MIGQWIILSLAVVCLFAAIYYVTKAFSGRGRIPRAAYNVQRHQAQRIVQINLLWGGLAFGVGIVLLLISGLSALTTGVNPLALPTPTAISTPEPTATTPPTVTPLFVFTVTPSPQPGGVEGEETAVFTPPAVTPAGSATLIPTPTNSPTAGPPTAIVTSNVGVWVRAEPNIAGAQLERALTNSLLILLDGQETADGFTWQRVQTTSGNEGWVAVDFIEIQNP